MSFPFSRHRSGSLPQSSLLAPAANIPAPHSHDGGYLRGSLTQPFQPGACRSASTCESGKVTNNGMGIYCSRQTADCRQRDASLSPEAVPSVGAYYRSARSSIMPGQVQECTVSPEYLDCTAFTVGRRPRDSAKAPNLAQNEKTDNVDPNSKWVFRAPPNNKRTFYFGEDNIEFSSEFDSGNLIQAERIGPMKYNFYSSMDCGNCEMQTNNRQWFHFSIRGGIKGKTLSITFIGMINCSMYTYEWMPVMAITPHHPAYSRIPGKAVFTQLEAMPPTPGYPLLVHQDVATRRAMAAAANGLSPNALSPALLSVANEDSDAGEPTARERDPLPIEDDDDSSPPDRTGKKKTKGTSKKKKYLAMNLEFEFRIDVETPLQSPHPLGHPDCHAIYIASNHPYPYSTLQRNIRIWQLTAAGRMRGTVSQEEVAVATKCGVTDELKIFNFPENVSPGHEGDIYFHREILCKTLEGRDVELLTISDMAGIILEERGMPMLDAVNGIPYSSAKGRTTRPRCFQGKKYIVLSARVHAGECPASHILHGSIEFLLNSKDLRAAALRRHFVIFIVPMLNPDGVFRGHSRVDAAGVDLNRMYRNPSFMRHPAAFSLWQLLASIHKDDLALYVDMHAHSNKRGTFFYGNAMNAVPQVQNILYAKLVALNTPYMDFTSCNYTDVNMSTVSRAGVSKDGSCRVVLFTERGVLHSYAIEASHVAGKTINAVAALPSIPGEEFDSMATHSTAVVPRYTPNTFGDTGKAVLLGMLDLHSHNPVSRIPLTPYQTVKGIALWIQRQLQLEIAEKLFAQAYKEHGVCESKIPGQTVLGAIMATLRQDGIPEKLTLKACRAVPPTTLSELKEFIPIDLATSLLAQTPAAGPPRSLLSGSNRQKNISNNAPAVSPAAAALAAAVGLELLDTPPPPPAMATRTSAK